MAILSGCAAHGRPKQFEPPEVIQGSDVDEFNDIPPPAGGKLVAAVYDFQDLTGQRKPSIKGYNIRTK